MSPTPSAISVAERYDRSLCYARHNRLPPGYPRPHSTSDWPLENIELLERYCAWRLEGGASAYTTHVIYMPMTGHVLGLALKPHSELDLDVDLQPAMDYILAKKLSPFWTKVCRNALENFRKFLCQERGIIEITVTPYDHAPHTQGLPAWLVGELKHYQLVSQRNWRPARLGYGIRRFWSGHLRIWRFLCGQCGVVELSDIQRKHIFDFMEQRLASGYAVSGINNNVREFHGFLSFLQEQGYSVPQALFRVPGLKQPQRLPKFLTDEQVRLLRDDFESRVQTASSAHNYRDALLDRTAFYLLWQGGMRLGEVEELRLEDLHLESRKLTVRCGKGMKDRTVFLTDMTVRALQAFLTVRGPGPSDHVFLFRNRALCKDLVRDRIKAAGRRVGVNVQPHRLRHTCATQLLNAGCRVTSIQRFLGHKRLNTTMVYAKVHDHKVADDYYAAMKQVEKRLDLAGKENVKVPIGADERSQLLDLIEQLSDPNLKKQARLELITQMRWLLAPKNVLE